MKNLVILPVYNEVDNINNVVMAILNLDISSEILIIDDDSPDGTGKAADRLSRLNNRVKVIHRERKLGLGTAYLAGFQFALKNGFDYIITMDSDFSHNPNDLPRLLGEAEKGFDLVIGSRYIWGIRVNNWPFERLLLSKFANIYADFILGTGVMDLTSGFRCYRSSVFNKVDFFRVRSKGYAFLIEIAYKIFKKGFPIKEVPIIFSEREGGVSKMSLKIKIEAFFAVIFMKLLVR